MSRPGFAPQVDSGIFGLLVRAFVTLRLKSRRKSQAQVEAHQCQGLLDLVGSSGILTSSDLPQTHPPRAGEDTGMMGVAFCTVKDRDAGASPGCSATQQRGNDKRL